MPRPAHRAIVAHLDDFLANIDVARKTEATYRYALQTFAAFLLDQSQGTPRRSGDPATASGATTSAAVVPASRLREDSLSRFRHWMRHDRGLSRRSEGTYLAAAVRYVEWLDANQLLIGNITSSRMKLILRNARGRRRTGYQTQPIKEAVPLIIAYYDGLPLPDPSSARGRRQRLSVLRNRAIVHTLFATGLRAHELAALRRADCAEGAGDKIRITGKGEKERLVALNAEAHSAIRAYLRGRDERAAAARGRTVSGDEPLFVRHDRDTLAAITTKSVWAVVSQAARALGLPARVSPHDFRRYIATTMLSEGMPLESVQAFLGHESIVTTRTVYAHTWSEVLDEQVQTYRPTPAQALRRAQREGRAGGN
jgi:integrase/recombinase XerD